MQDRDSSNREGGGGGGGRGGGGGGKGVEFKIYIVRQKKKDLCIYT